MNRSGHQHDLAARALLGEARGVTNFGETKDARDGNLEPTPSDVSGERGQPSAICLSHHLFDLEIAALSFFGSPDHGWRGRLPS